MRFADVELRLQFKNNSRLLLPSVDLKSDNPATLYRRWTHTARKHCGPRGLLVYTAQQPAGSTENTAGGAKSASQIERTACAPPLLLPGDSVLSTQ